MTQATGNNMRRQATANAAGFTLLEVLVALAIVGMIVLALYASLSIAFKARKTALNHLTNIRQARLAMEMIGKDLQTALPPTGVLAGAFTATPNDPGFELDSLEFYNTAPPGPAIQGAGDMQHVVFKIMSEADALLPETDGDPDTVDPRDQGPRLEPSLSQNTSQYVLVRRVTRRLLAQVTPEPSSQIVVRHVRTFTVRLYDGSSWLDTWDSTTLDNTLPLAIEITLVIEPVSQGDGLSLTSSSTSTSAYTLTRVFPIMAATEATDGSQVSLADQVGGGRL